MKQSEPAPVRRHVIVDALHIFGLVGLAVAYPLYHFLRANPAYLVVNDVPASRVFVLILLLSVLVPAALVLVNLTLRTISRKLYGVTHFLTVTALVALGFMPLLSRFDPLPVWILFGLCIVFTVFFMQEYRSNQYAYWCLCVLIPIAAAFPIHFAMDGNIRQILNPQDTEAINLAPLGDTPLPPVVMIIYDEFPLVDLLDIHGAIDGSRFPNFAALRDESVWYANATTVYDQTLKAVPAMLTGRYPEEEVILPLPQNYPESLFNILRSYYEIHAFEPVTKLTDAIEGVEPAAEGSGFVFTSDLAIFYARALLPRSAADAWLPMENGIWGGFLERMPDRQEEDSKKAMSAWLKEQSQLSGVRDRYGSAQAFIQEMGTYPRNTFHFFHVTIPHHPYEYQPSGERYWFDTRKDADPAQTIRLKREAHILQAGLADTILGEFRAELERLERWDDALVIVVADHGEGYMPGVNNRILTPENLGYVGFVPLVIKYPGQRVGARDDTNVQTIDIAPTILDVIDIQNAPRMDGRSLLDEDAAIPELKYFGSISDDIYKVDETIYTAKRATARRDAARFFSLADPSSDLFNYGAGMDYLGQSQEALTPHALPYQIGVLDLESFQNVDLNAERLPYLMMGEVLNAPELNPEEYVIVMCINGTARAFTPPFYSLEQKLVFQKVLPEGVFEATNTIELLLLPAEIPELGTTLNSTP